MLVNQNQVDCNHTCIYCPTKNIQELRVINNYNMIIIDFQDVGITSSCFKASFITKPPRMVLTSWASFLPSLAMSSLVEASGNHHELPICCCGKKKENINLQTWWSNLVVFTPPIITHLQMMCLHIACAQYSIHSICRLHIYKYRRLHI